MNPPPLTRRQRDILEFFRGFTEAEGMSPTLEEVAQNFGLSKVTIFGHVAELERKGFLRRVAPGISRGIVLADAEDVSTDAAAVPVAGRGISSAPGSSDRGPDLAVLPILGTIAAGSPIATIEEPEPLDLGSWASPGKDVYVLRVSGDSMIEDSICDGDLVVVERRTDPRDGETVVAVLPDEEATLKRFYREPDGRIRLQPANASLQPLFVDEVAVRGVVIGVVRRMD